MEQLIMASTMQQDLHLAQNRLDYLNMVAPATAARALHIERWVVQQQVFTLERELEEQRIVDKHERRQSKSAVTTLREWESKLPSVFNAAAPASDASHHGSTSDGTGRSSVSV